MKRRNLIIALACLLAAVGAWLIWPHGRSEVALIRNERVTATAGTVTNAVGASAPLAAAPPKISTLNTNRLAYRLSNTTNLIGELETAPHAILLANAFIDTDKSLDLKIPAHLRSKGDPGAYIVQARGQTDAAFRLLLQSAGAQIVSYIPNNAYLVNVPSINAGLLAANPLVQAVLPYEPYYKMQSSLLGLAVNQQPLPPGTALTLGVFAADAQTAEAQIQQLGAHIIGRDQSPFGPVLRVLAPSDWTTLVQLPAVQYVEPAYARHAANDLSRVTLGISPDTISGITNDYLGLNGSGVLVAVNDSGVDAAHPDFSVGGTAANPGTVPPSRVTGFTPLDLVDTNGHGTHIAGIIAGNGSESYPSDGTNVGAVAEGSVPFADFRGKAPWADLFSLNMSGYSDYQLQTNAAVVGALISNNSWDYGNGSGSGEYDLAAASYDFATRDALPFTTGSQPVLFVFAAGNEGGGNDDGAGGNGDSILSPGTAKNVITVGALEQLRNITNLVTTITPGSGTNAPTTNQVAYWQPQTDSSEQVASYSSRGNVGVGTEGAFGRFKPDVIAPGTFVVSTSSQFNGQWATNAYYNPTNDSVTTYDFQEVETNNLQYYNVAVPPNAVAVNITITADRLSPTPFPNLAIYCQISGPPDPVNAPNLINLITTNSVSIPPGGGTLTIGSIQNNGFDFAVGNANNFPVNYNLTVDVLTTNSVGDQYSVLEGMNDSLGGYYRYESGTSMAAAGISGLLALIQDYFTNQFQPALIPSPALMKALIINGARSDGDYTLAFTNGLNFQGWGLDSIQNCIPANGLMNQVNTPGSSFFVDQNPSTALATGDSRTFTVTINTNSDSFAQYFQLQATLVWTDPPGDPAAAIKLVNDLELIITNLDTGDVFFGNDISPDVGYNLPWDTTGPPNLDLVNNVQCVLLPPLLAGSYSVTVLGRSVNVNAVTAQTNNAQGQYAPNIVQDYALVVSVGEGEVTNAFTVTDNGIVSNPTGDQDFTVITSTNAPLVNQMVGASSPLLGTNTLPLGSKTIWGPNGLLTIGQTNQWHFYVVTNTGVMPDYTNAAFLTFNVNTLSIPRMGVYEDNVTNATKPEANLDLFVTEDPTITNLNPVAISNCLAGVGNSRASLNNAGTQFVFYTNSVPGASVYYIGVQSEDQMASEYDFLPLFTDIPFGSLDQNGNEIVNGLLLPMPVGPGSNAHPFLTNVFALAIIPMEVEKVTVTNLVEHQNFGDLVGTLSFGGQYAILNNHDGFGNTFGTRPIVYDDTPQANRPLGTTNTDGPGSLQNFRGLSALGPWILGELANSAGGYTGQVSRLTLLIQPHRDLKQPGIIVSVPPGGWFIDYVDVTPGFTNLTFYATNVTSSAGTPPLQMYEQVNTEPTLNNYDQEETLTNGTPPGNSISIGPPLPQGRYFIGIYNPQTTSANVFISATLGIDASVSDIFNYTSGGGQVLPDDAVTGSVIQVPNTVTQLVSSLNVGLVINSPRISDYTFTLVSPDGQRVLLMENRGAGDTNGAGLSFVYTNILNSTATGGAAANTNYLAVDPLGTTVPITWNFYTVPDQMTVYDTTNPVDFNPNGPYLLYNTGLTNNPPAPGGGSANTLPFTYNLTVPPGVSNITIIMNQLGNPDAGDGDAWVYTAGAPITNYEYLVFTDNTNLADVPIKFAETPFNFAESSTNFILSDFDLAVATNYYGPTNIADGFGTGWSVPTNVVTYSTIVINGQFATATNVVVITNNLVSVVNDPSSALTGDASGSNVLALARGTITRSFPTVPGHIYNVTFWYRGPGIAGWWRGEGNATDSSDPENLNNNGALIGRFNFPAGEVDQAFGFGDPGNTYQFAATNTYVQVPPSPSLNVGAGGGFTIEGWINPTNLSRPEPIFEWLARVPTNTATADTNLAIVQGPVFNPATGHYYYLLAATNWIRSETWAKELGGDLVTLETANEGQWVYDTFTAYGTLNRDLWIGLNDHVVPGNFQWVSGLASSYFNWAPGQPGTCGDQYVAIMGPTNSYPGLWNLEGPTGETCGDAPVLPTYGVVEVPQIPTNGVQLWVSGTNGTPGGANALQGALCANIVDANYVSHQIISAPGLLTSNVYQHVALTYNTNSGIASLYLNGTNVATANLGVFMPKTDGDLLIGWDMSPYTNNFFGGEMDEMSLYSRPLSLAEISAIYHVSADTTNRLIGKFDPSVTPAAGLAEALVAFGPTTNVIFGVNDQWSVNSYTFTATTNSMPLTISGLEPGILLDSFAVSEAPETNLYYLPEQALASLAGTPADGAWTLQVWDNRAGAFATNVNQLVNWQLSLTLASNAIVSATLQPETALSSTVAAGQTVYYAVPVPAWAHEATNLLVSSSLPVDLLYFSPANPPTGANAPDLTMLTGQTSGIGSPILVTNGVPPLAALRPGQTYYLAVKNNNARSAEVNLEVDFDILGLTNGVPVTGDLTNEYQSVRYFSYDVGSNAYEATFQLLQLSGNADLVVRKGIPLPDLESSDVGSFSVSNADEAIYVLTNSTPLVLSPGRWYLGVFNRDSTVTHYSVLAKELDIVGGVTNFTVISLTNGVPFTWNAGPGADLTNFFVFHAVNPVVGGNTVYLQGLRFELFNMSGNGDLTVETNAPPLAPPFFQTSQNSGNSPELVFVFTNSALANLAGDWYLGVPNLEVTNINYTIIAEILTNSYFPAFPGAQGAGGGAQGGRFGDVYHVTTAADSGPGSLRDAINSMVTNRTVVFDVSGAISLQSPLIITNSYLTIAGETAPGGGITVAGQMTTVSSAHDVIIRDVRFRGAIPSTGFTNSFDSAAVADYKAGQTVATWTVTTNQTSVVADSADAYPGHSHFLALANGVISNSILTVPGISYTLTVPYRGPGIAAWWRGENNLSDSVGGNNGVPENGGPVFGTAEVGTGLYFDGAQELVLVNTTPELNVGLLSGITIEGWIKPTRLTSSMLICEFERAPATGIGTDVGVQFGINAVPNSGLIPGSIAFNMVDTTTTSHILGSAANCVTAGVWNHFAMTYDKTSGLEVIYANGVQVKQGNLGICVPQTSFSDLMVGGRTTYSSLANPTDQVAGGMDELSFYGRALSPSEIKAIFSNGSAGKFDPAIFSGSPADSVAEATFSIPGVVTNVIVGNNTNWQVETVTFTATGTTTPLVIKGIEPGVLLDSVLLAPGGGLAGSLQFNAVSNVIADHVSTSWSTNSDLAVLSSTNVTVQWSIIADSLYSTNDPGIGSLLRQGNGTLSFHHNLYADNYTGSPRLGDSLTLDFVNNVIYNWGYRSGLTGSNDLDYSPNGYTNQLNYVCNYLIAGPDTAAFSAGNYNITNIAFFGSFTNAEEATWIYQTNNFIDSDVNGMLNGSDTDWGMFTNDYTPLGRGFPTPPVAVDEAYQAYEKVLDFAGVNLALRDPADTNIVTNVREQTGRIIGSAPSLPGLNPALPYLDTDQDGIPDFWEDTFTPKLVYVPSNNNDRNGDGYTDLEEYNNWLAAPHALTVTNTAVGVDLYQLFGESGNLAFFVTNGIHGQVYLTNVWAAVTNSSAVWSNSIAVFTPTNSSAASYSGYASFDCYVTNLDTAAYFGPVTVSVIVSAVPVAINSNFPPVITPLISGVSSDPTNYGGSDFYSITVTTNDYGALFEIDNPTGPMALVVKQGLPLPSLSSYNYYTNAPPWPANEEIAVLTNTQPVPLSPGTWYMAAVNVSGSNVVYTAKISLLQSLWAPEFLYPTNGAVFTDIETRPFTVTCIGQDTNTPPLPLTFALVNGPTNMTVSPSGLLAWTPSESQGGTTNTVAVDVSNGAFSVTNTFTVIVEISNQPPVLPMIPNQLVIEPGGQLLVTNTALNPNLPNFPLLGYTLTNTVTGGNVPVIDTNGIITWTPQPVQGGSNYLITTVVTDSVPGAINATSLSATNSFYVTVLPELGPGTPVGFTNINAGQIVWFAIPVPTNAIYATNTLVYSTLPINLWFSTNLPPSITNAADRVLLFDATNGVSVLSTNWSTAPTNIVPGGYYLLGVQNTNNAGLSGELAISFAFAASPYLSLPYIPDQYLVAGDTLVVADTANDQNPGAVLAYSLLNPLPGATINASGVITWPTTVPTTAIITAVVTDTGANVRATNSFAVIVLPGLGAGGPGSGTVGAGLTNWYIVRVPLNADAATNTLLIANAPVNLEFSTNRPPSIGGLGDAELLTNSTIGSQVITPGSAPPLVPGGRYFLGVQNTNNFAVNYEVNVTFHLVPLPIFSIVQTNLAGTNGFQITWFAPTNYQFHLQWTPLLAPAAWKNFNGVISDVSLQPGNGQFQYFDDGSQTGGFGATRFYRLLLLNSPTNTAPFFLNVPGFMAAPPSVPFVYTNAAADWDLPQQELTYFVTNTLAGTNVTINSSTGVIMWTPDPLLEGLTNFITTVVVDNGVPEKSATNEFAVVVTTNLITVPAFGSIAIVSNGVKFQWTAPTNDEFQIRWTTNLALPNWHLFPNTNTSTTGTFSFVDTNMPLLWMKFYQLILLP